VSERNYGMRVGRSLDLVGTNLGDNGLKSNPHFDDVPEIASSRQHFEAYFTEQGMKEMTGYHDKRDWYLLTIKENFDNSIDFLWRKYPRQKPKISATVKINDANALFECNVTNSNPDNKPIKLLSDFDKILDYNMTYGTKQNEFVISRRLLGDATKRLAAIPYILMHDPTYKKRKETDESDLSHEYWNKALVIRANGEEAHTIIKVDTTISDSIPDCIRWLAYIFRRKRISMLMPLSFWLQAGLHYNLRFYFIILYFEIFLILPTLCQNRIQSQMLMKYLPQCLLSFLRQAFTIFFRDRGNFSWLFSYQY